MGSGHEKDTFELSCQNRDLHERVVHERYKDAAIGEELECQHERGNAAALKIFHVFNFGCSCAPSKIPIYSRDATFSFGLFHTEK